VATCPRVQVKNRFLRGELGEVSSSVPPKLSYQRCERIVQAVAASRPIARPGLLDHLPRDRQCEIYDCHGIELERSTLADWGHCRIDSRLSLLSLRLAFLGRNLNLEAQLRLSADVRGRLLLIGLFSEYVQRNE